MAFEDKLTQLALNHGIEPFYWDINGKKHVATEEAKIRILGCMGVAASTEAEIDQSLADYHRSRIDAALSPVLISSESSPTVEIAFDCPADRLSTPVEWEIIDQGRNGSFTPGDCRKADGHDSSHGYEKRVAVLPADLALGYHSIEFQFGGQHRRSMLLKSPNECFYPDSSRKLFGLALQLYSLRSDRNLGIGDLKDISDAQHDLIESGCSFVGLNPLHAVFENSGDNFSPYSPSSRFAWNALIIAHEEVPEFQNSDAARALFSNPRFAAELKRARSASLVDYLAVWKLKLEIFEQLFLTFQEELTHGTERANAFRNFCDSSPPAVREYAVYAALREQLLAENPAHWGWPAWPEKFRDPRGEAVRIFQEDRAGRIEFYLYLQFLADSQVRAVEAGLRRGGMEIGLYLDLALGANIGGAETWWRQDLYAFNASAGAPPDNLGPLGQNWGLPPALPAAMLRSGLSPFREAISVSTSVASAVRIDHVMSMFRLFWIPNGSTAANGAYVRYPFQELLAVLAIESQKNRCLVIGEDLGTVPDEVRDGMKKSRVLSYKVLFFSQNAERFLNPDEYAAQALVVTGTHDIPPLQGYWLGNDIEFRNKLGLFQGEEFYTLLKTMREQDKSWLFEALNRFLKLEPGAKVPEKLSREQLIQFHEFLASTPCWLQAIQIEDLLQQVDQANVPGTVDEHPNWRRKIKKPISEILNSRFSQALLAKVREHRG